MPDTSGIDETKHIIAYRGGPSGAGDFPGTFVSTSAEAAGQYGDVSAVGVPRGLKVLSIEDSEAMQLAKRFARKHPDEAAALNNDVLAGEEPADLFMFPTKKWTALLKSEGYQATKMGEDLFVFDGIKLQKPKAAPRGQAMPDADARQKSDQAEWDNLQAQWAQQGVKISPSVRSESGGGAVRPNKIVVPKEKRNQGIGSKVMEEMVALADRQGRTIVMTPSKDFGGSSVDRLKNFYTRFGFVKNAGRNKDFSISETMYRLPKK
jgi:GNAT superfamily N-acetyltransferase